jgi:hypothetical protein
MPVLPPGRIAPVVQAGDDEESVRPDLEEQAVREGLGQVRTTHLVEHARELFGVIGQASDDGIERATESFTQTGGSPVVPILGLIRLGFGEGRE